MFESIKYSSDDLRVILRNTAVKMSINEAVVEKDYWVSFILEYLFHHCEYKDRFAFKGGTSLSKCYNIIERFSEDIDLILDWRVLGYDIYEPWEERSATKQHKFNKESNKRVEDFIGYKLIKIMDEYLSELLDTDYELTIDEEDPQTILFHYPTVFHSSYLAQSIRIEVGVLAAWTPSKIETIVPYAYDFYPHVFSGDKVEVKTVSPLRTFWEKATILHHEANRPINLNMPHRYARHYYDLYCIGKSEYGRLIHENLELLEQVVRFKEKFYPRRWAKYEEATSKKIKLVPNNHRLEELKRDYLQMEEMFFGEHPSFDELIAEIEKLEKEIHSI